jgi:hypothetical protein
MKVRPKVNGTNESRISKGPMKDDGSRFLFTYSYGKKKQETTKNIFDNYNN